MVNQEEINQVVYDGGGNYTNSERVPRCAQRYVQSYFVDQPQYSRWSEEEKQKAHDDERRRVKIGSALGNAICTTAHPEQAAFIASRLNLADELEQLVRDYAEGNISGILIAKYVAEKMKND